MTNSEDSKTQSGHERRLDRIVTEKSAIKRALGEPVAPPTEDDDPKTRREKEVARAQQRLDRERQIKRYQVASMAYIGAMLRNPDAVSTVWERIVDKWLEGKLSNYDVSLSFRAYLKTVLRHEVFAFSREQKYEAEKGPTRMDSGYDVPDGLEATASEAFDQKLQDTILERALEAVRQEDTQYYETLKLLMNAAASEDKAPKSKDLAAFLSEVGKTNISEDNARRIKSRARHMYSRKIIEQIGLFIESTDLSKIETAARDWNLIAYCEKVLREMRGDNSE